MRLRSFLIILAALCAVVLLPHHAALAAECTGASGFPDPLCGADVPELVNRLISAALGLVGALFFVMFLWGGFQYMTAGGDAGQVKKARTTLTNAVIGIIIIGLSYAIVNTIIERIAASANPVSSDQSSGPPATP